METILIVTIFLAFSRGICIFAENNTAMRQLYSLSFLFLFAINVIAQNGWLKRSKTDEYTQEKSDICVFYKNGDIKAIFFPEDNHIKIFRYYDGLQHFQDTWDAMMDNRGQLTSYTTDMTERFIFNIDYKEYDLDDHSIYYPRVSRPGQDFYSYFFVEEKIEDLKKAKSVSYKWYDRLDDEIAVMNISLMGFTKCYNSCKFKLVEKVEEPDEEYEAEENNVAESSDILPPNIRDESSNETTDDNNGYYIDRQPEYPGGMDAMMLYLSKNLRYPPNAQENNIQGRVVVKFWVDKEGYVNDVTVVKGLDPECDKEAVRLVSSMSRWKPGTVNGKPADMHFTCPIMFKLP